MLQTEWGKREIASFASGALSGEGKTAEIAGIEGFLPFDVVIIQPDNPLANVLWSGPDNLTLLTKRKQEPMRKLIDCIDW